MTEIMKKLLFCFAILIGTVTSSQAQIVRDRYNSQIGKVETDGTIRDRYNSQIGKVDRDGTVRDRYNSQIGSAKGVEPRIAAVLFFMNLLR